MRIPARPIVIPAKAGIHSAFGPRKHLRMKIKMDPRFRGDDGLAGEGK
jgi:hypothetical protein